MPKTLTENELKIRQSLASARKYPRWKYMSFTKGFRLYVAPMESAAEVFKHPDGRWSVGKFRHPLYFFNYLEDALFYAERLVNLPIEIKRSIQSVLQPRHAPIMSRDSAVEEKLQRDGVMLQP